MNQHDISQRADIKGYDALEALALNLRASWNHATDEIWMKLDPELWELTKNPWAVLRTISRDKLAKVLKDPEFIAVLDRLTQTRNHAINQPSWFSQKHPSSSISIAYFSMEYMLSEALPIYSGGLGNVAGDQLKAASDLDVPVIAIGLLYSQGYFRQIINEHGEQQELYPYNDPGQLPIKPLRLPNGEWLRLKIELPGWSLWLRAWEVKVSRRTLYLLDSNDIANIPAHRGITSELYGGDREMRLKQELILGIGGWRLLTALGLEPEICHMNEGHAAFAVLERTLTFMYKYKQPFDVAFAATRAGNHFTTHTAVAAGFDRFSPDLIIKYLGKYAETKLNISIEKLLKLGQLNPYDDFNMAYLAIRGSGSVNGVSQLHGLVSRHLFQELFPRRPIEEIPVGFVTNGVHIPSWDAPVSEALWSEACGKECWLGETNKLQDKIRSLPDEKIWEMRNKLRTNLIEYTRARLTKLLEARGATKEDIEKSKQFLNPDVLTLGFARRFASYKRPDLLLSDQNRFLSIIKNQDRPIQLIIAGKAHPADKEGHDLIKKWMDFITKTEARCSVVFLSDYDVLVTEHLVTGVDLWINTPERPWEACGTSGMKILVNGGLNLSELDGWWAEAYSPQVGWALGDGKEHEDHLNIDHLEAASLYDLLEKEVIPLFYKRNDKNMPVDWVAKIRESMARLTTHFSSNRAVREYTEKFYLPGADKYHQRTADNCALAKQIVDWKKTIDEKWDHLKFGPVKIDTSSDKYHFEVQVYLNNLDPKTVQVELYSRNVTNKMDYKGPVSEDPQRHLYTAEILAEQAETNFTPRLIPYFPDVATPLETNQILWLR